MRRNLAKYEQYRETELQQPRSSTPTPSNQRQRSQNVTHTSGSQQQSLLIGNKQLAGMIDLERPIMSPATLVTSLTKQNYPMAPSAALKLTINNGSDKWRQNRVLEQNTSLNAQRPFMKTSQGQRRRTQGIQQSTNATHWGQTSLVNARGSQAVDYYRTFQASHTNSAQNQQRIQVFNGLGVEEGLNSHLQEQIGRTPIALVNPTNLSKTTRQHIPNTGQLHSGQKFSRGASRPMPHWVSQSKTATTNTSKGGLGFSRPKQNFPEFKLYETLSRTGMEMSTKFKSSNYIDFNPKKIKSSEDFSGNSPRTTTETNIRRGTNLRTVDIDQNHLELSDAFNRVDLVENMQLRNQAFREEARLHQINHQQAQVIKEQEREILDLKRHLRIFFEKNDNKVINASLLSQQQQHEQNVFPVPNHFSEQKVENGVSQQPQTENEIEGSFPQAIQYQPRKKEETLNTQVQAIQTEAKRNVSNIHQLYQDLFIQDMRRELAAVNQEVEALRQELIVRDETIVELASELDRTNRRLELYRKIASDEQGKVSEKKLQDSENKQDRKHFVEQMIMRSFKENLSHRFTNKLGFRDSAQLLQDMIQAKSVPALVQSTRRAMIRVFGAETVDFLFMDREATVIYREQGGTMETFHHAHFSFEIAVLSQQGFVPLAGKQLFEFTPHFRLLRDVDRHQQFSRRHCVWPMKLANQQKNLCLVQLQRDKLMPAAFHKVQDGEKLQLFNEIFGQVYQNIVTTRQVTNSQMRAFEILETFKEFLCERKHVSLCQRLQAVLPDLFDFESCGVLFVDPVTKDLFMMEFKTKGDKRQAANQANEESDGEETKMRLDVRPVENVVRFPTNIGCTGQAIQSNQLVFFNEGETAPAFAAKIDNCNNVSKVESMLIGPIFDQKGALKGVIQLVNKQNGQKISHVDVNELQSLLPALAEIISTVEVVKKISDISTGIEEYMIKMKEHVLASADKVENHHIIDISHALHQISFAVKEMMNNQRTKLAEIC